MHDLKPIDVIALLLVIAGGLSWGLVGLFEFDLVAATAGRLTMVLARIIYVLTGFAAIWTGVRSPYFAHMTKGHWHKPHPA